MGNSNQHLPVQCNNELNRQRDGAGETSRTRQITSCLRRDGQHARPSHKHCKPCAGHAHAPPPRARTRLHKFHSVGNSNQPVPVQCNNDLKQQRDGARETSRNDKLRVAWERLGSTRAHLANTAKRAPNMLTHHHHVRVHVCTSSIQWEIQTNPYQSSETTTCNTNVTAPLKPQENEQITSCLGSDGQHAQRTRKHCRPCEIHARDTGVRARTCLHGLFSVEHSYQPGTFQ